MSIYVMWVYILDTQRITHSHAITYHVYIYIYKEIERDRDRQIIALYE